MADDFGRTGATGEDDQHRRIGIPAKSDVNMVLNPRQKIHRVPIQLRVRKPKQQHVYDPMMVSIGPYHHGKPHLQPMEEFKRDYLARFVSGSGRDKGFFYSMIFERIDHIRSCYVGVTAEYFDDSTLTEMILHDAGFVICAMKASTDDEESALFLTQQIGVAAAVLAGPELLMLENQIPYWVIKLLLFSRFGEEEGESVLRKFLNNVCFSDMDEMAKISWEGEEDHDQPLHLPEAIQRILSGQSEQRSRVSSRYGELKIKKRSNMISKYYWRMKTMEEEEKKNYKFLSRQFHSVTYLKSKGIHFGPSSVCLRDMSFRSHAFHGQLLLPVRIIYDREKIILVNVIAYEMSPGVVSDLAMTSYVNFMKRLIESDKDVKELRDKGILFSNLASDEEVVELFQGIDTLGMDIDFFDEVKMSIIQHCRNKSKTWVAELMSSYLSSPWTILAMLSAIFLLIFTFLQTFYTILAA